MSTPVEATLSAPSSPILQVLDRCPNLLDKHSDFMSAGGDQLLMAMQNSIHNGMWPWNRPAEQTAQFGAFCAGVAWSCNFIRELVRFANDRKALGDLVVAASASGSDVEDLKALLIRDHGFSAADFEKQTKKG